MARFRYLGEPPRPGLVVAYGTTNNITVPMSNGTPVVLLPVPPATRFVIGDDIGHEITDVIALINFRADTERFEEII